MRSGNDADKDIVVKGGKMTEKMVQARRTCDSYEFAADLFDGTAQPSDIDAWCKGGTMLEGPSKDAADCVNKRSPGYICSLSRTDTFQTKVYPRSKYHHSSAKIHSSAKRNKL